MKVTYIGDKADVKPKTKTVTGSTPSNCPSCNNENIQTIKMMCLSGTTSGSSTAVGVPSGLELGVGIISNNSKTNLASAYIPGIKPRMGPLIMRGLYIYDGGQAEKFKIWENKTDFYEKGWICHRCGNTWVP